MSSNDNSQSQPLLDDVDGDRAPTTTTEQLHEEPDENLPLLSHTNDTPRYDGEETLEPPSVAAASLRSIHSGSSSSSVESGVSIPKVVGRPWASLAAIAGLIIAVLLLMAGLYFTPAIVEDYGKWSMVIEPTSISIDSFTPTGVRARVQADFKMDASRCKNTATRTIGRLGTYIVHMVESEETEVKVYLPEYDDMLIGIATMPKVHASLRNGEVTNLDFIADVRPGKITGLQRIINDWANGRLGELTLKGMADVSIRHGAFPLGTLSIAPTLVLEGHDIPNIPAYNITKLSFQEVDLPDFRRRRAVGRRGMAAEAMLTVENDYPISLSIPPLDFDILVANCAAVDPYITLAEASTKPINVQPKSDIEVNVGGIVRELPNSLTKPCPSTELSPLDKLLSEYINGADAMIYVRGSKNPSSKTPPWISDFLSTITIPIPFPGRNFDDLVKNFTLKDVHFGLPDPFAEPNSPESNPRISGNIIVLAALPKEMNFSIDVSQIRATADVFHEGKKLGVLDLKKWQKAHSKKIDATDETNAMLEVQSEIKDAPLNITDQDVFSDVAQKILLGDGVTLDVKALVDVEVQTVLGSLIVKGLSGEGSVPIKAPSKGGLKGELERINPHIFDLKILDTSETSLTLEAKVNFTNPTRYTASVPYFNIHVLSNNSVIAQATVRDTEVITGNNSNVVVQVLWDPVHLGDANSSSIARNLLSQYISGWNTTLTFQTHNGSIPGQPALGESLSKFPIEVPMPHLSTPHDGSGDDDDGGDEGPADRPRFIKDATFHLFSSTAVFTLLSPLKTSSIYIESINATAFYNHTEPVGTIVYELPFKVPPGTSQTPRLPVDWDPESVGYRHVREALGGGLKLAARAEVKVKLGRWRERVWFRGEGIGARVRL